MKNNQLAQNQQQASSLNNPPRRLILGDIPAKVANDTSDILNLETKDRFTFVKGSKITGVYVFCGKGTSKEFRDAEKFAKKIKGDVSKMQHCAGYADITDGNRVLKNREIHWVQEENGPIKLAFIKKHK